MCIDIAREAMTRLAAGATLDELRVHIEKLFRPHAEATRR